MWQLLYLECLMVVMRLPSETECLGFGYLLHNSYLTLNQSLSLKFNFYTSRQILFIQDY